MARHLTRNATLLALLFCATVTPTTQAQIVSDVTGQIDLMQAPFFPTRPVWSEEENKTIWVPNEPQHDLYPVGTDNQSVSFDGGGYYSMGGLSEIDYSFTSQMPGAASWEIHAYTEVDNSDYGSGGYALLTTTLTVSAPVYFHFQADTDQTSDRYEVSFNEKSAYASVSRGVWDGTFPLLFFDDNPMPTGFGTYVDEGILPAGTYEISIRASAGKYRLSGGGAEGSASLHIQLLGDTDLDGTVGMHDLETVLNNWNQPAPDGSMPADLNGDGYVGIDDLGQVLTAWNSDVRPASPPVSVSNVPEPTTAGLFSVGVLALTAYRSRRAYRVNNAFLGTGS